MGQMVNENFINFATQWVALARMEKTPKNKVLWEQLKVLWKDDIEVIKSLIGQLDRVQKERETLRDALYSKGHFKCHGCSLVIASMPETKRIQCPNACGEMQLITKEEHIQKLNETIKFLMQENFNLKNKPSGIVL